MIPITPSSTSTDTPLPTTTLFRSETLGPTRPSGSPGPGDQIETGAGTGLDPGGPAQPSPQALCFTELSERTITQRAIRSGRYTPWLNFELNLQGLAHESVRQNPGRSEERRGGKERGSTCRSRGWPEH